MLEAAGSAARRRKNLRAADVHACGRSPGFSFLTCLQQSVMNLGILLVQGRVNSFGPGVMAAFAATVKIDAFAYMPVQDFGNAFSTFIAQNYGAGEKERIRRGLRGAVLTSVIFCLAVSALVWIFARPADAVVCGRRRDRHHRRGRPVSAYRGSLLLWYRLSLPASTASTGPSGRPGMSVVLTVISLGTRVALAYLLSAIPAVGVVGIWWSVPIGWLLADLAGVLYLIGRIRREAGEKNFKKI